MLKAVVETLRLRLTLAGLVVCLVTVRAVWTLSLLCMVRRKTPCELVALMVSGVVWVKYARAPTSTE